ncbi:hypothetical protein EBZ39_01900 [bacterium]|nr:hypothetical protein [bacterium]
MPAKYTGLFILGDLMALHYVYLLLGLAFVVGYVVGRLDFVVCRLTHANSTAHAVGTPQWNAQMRATRGSVPLSEPAVKIDINDTKVVLPVDTSGISKVSDVELGKTVAVKDDVTAAANKLAQLKAK